jgi:hypothetical protein
MRSFFIDFFDTCVTCAQLDKLDLPLLPASCCKSSGAMNCTHVPYSNFVFSVYCVTQVVCVVKVIPCSNDIVQLASVNTLYVSVRTLHTPRVACTAYK